MQERPGQYFRGTTKQLLRAPDAHNRASPIMDYGRAQLADYGLWTCPAQPLPPPPPRQAQRCGAAPGGKGAPCIGTKQHQCTIRGNTPACPALISGTRPAVLQGRFAVRRHKPRLRQAQPSAPNTALWWRRPPRRGLRLWRRAGLEPSAHMCRSGLIAAAEISGALWLTPTADVARKPIKSHTSPPGAGPPLLQHGRAHLRRGRGRDRQTPSKHGGTPTRLHFRSSLPDALGRTQPLQGAGWAGRDPRGPLGPVGCGGGRGAPPCASHRPISTPERPSLRHAAVTSPQTQQGPNGGSRACGS